MRSFFVMLSLSLASSCATVPKPSPWYEVHGVADAKTSRRLTQGELVGFVEAHGNMAWLGVPYAAPPVGPLRWKAPRAAPSWSGAREAVRYGALCPQLAGPLSRGDSDGLVAGNEDCLTLNVQTPPFTAEEAGRERRPVMVWIHGGGNTIGTANTYGIARNLALRHGVVVVGVNYRLGVLGWFHHPSLIDADGSPSDNGGNYGTLDLIAALRWVSENIAAFGGDPGDVTVFGESAGGFNVFSLLASPLAKGLFHRAISQSGLPASVPLRDAWAFTDDEVPGAVGSSGEVLLAQLLRKGAAQDRAEAKQVLAAMNAAQVASFLRGLTTEQLLAPFAGSGAGFGMYRSPALLRDGHVLPPTSVVEALGAGPTVPVLLGTNRDEFKLFMLGNPKYVRRFLGLHVKDEVAFERDARLVSDTWKALGTDAPAAALQAAGTPVYAYRFDWDEEPKHLLADLPKLLGAAHGLELGFVFDDEAGEFDPFGITSKANAAGRVPLARAMASYWVQFARAGQPGRGVDGTLPEWGGYGAEARFLVLDSEAGGGLRHETGPQTLDGIEARVWGAAPFASEEERCAAMQFLFKGFGGGAGAWTAERAARVQARCR